MTRAELFATELFKWFEGNMVAYNVSARERIAYVDGEISCDELGRFLDEELRKVGL